MPSVFPKIRASGCRLEKDLGPWGDPDFEVAFVRDGTAR